MPRTLLADILRLIVEFDFLSDQLLDDRRRILVVADDCTWEC